MGFERLLTLAGNELGHGSLYRHVSLSRLPFPVAMTHLRDARVNDRRASCFYADCRNRTHARDVGKMSGFVETLVLGGT
jgi:hypothetical protein